MRNLYMLLFGVVLLLISTIVSSQSPGIIVRPAGGPYSIILDPNQNGFTSANTSGFSVNDIGAGYSEIAYKVVPPIRTEPTGDLATGPSGGFTDIVKTVDNSGFYIYSDGTNLLFRLRIGAIISGSKGYSILLDTDGKMGNSGPNADTNYIAPTNTSNGNPGFEYEVVLETNFRVAVYNVNGVANPLLIASYPLTTHSQISVALSTDSGNPDYFYDFTVPLSAIGSPSSFRMVATTVTSPSSALQGSRSDIYGIDDANYPGLPSAWETVVNAQPPVVVADIEAGGTGPGPTCTSAPVITGPVSGGSNVSVSGTWTRLDNTKPSSATITLYKNGSAAGTTTVTSGSTWNIIVPTVVSGDIFYARAQATGESMCLQSNVITSGCSIVLSAPVLTCASSKGISGSIPAGSTILIYQLPATNASPTSSPLTTNITYPTATTFAYYVNGCSGGTNNVPNGTFMLMATNGSCTSTPVFECISSGASSLTGLNTNTLALTGSVYPYQTAINGTGSASGNILRLFINGKYSSTVTSTGTSFTFTGLALNAGDQLKIYVYAGSTCFTVSPVFTVSCYAQPPVITTNTSGQLLSTSTQVSGTGTAGASVTLYKGVAPSGVIAGSPVTVNASGNWSVSGLTIVAGENYYATQTTGGCASAASSGATVLAPTTICPTITGSYTGSSSSVVGSLPSLFTGTVNLYLDNTMIGSVAVSNSNSWSVASPFTYPLYPGGSLTARAQASGAAENESCISAVSIDCTTPLTPVISPSTITIGPGQTANFTVNNVEAGTWYALMDNSGTSFATSIYKPTTSSFSLITQPFGATGTYNLMLSADKLSGCPASFEPAIINVSTSLPVSLVDFTAAYQHNDNVVDLKWATSSEQNTVRFDVEKSLNGNHYFSIGSVAAVGNSFATQHYQFTDIQPEGTRIYYRLKITDTDSSVKYSKVAIVKLTQQLTASVAPNPFSDELKIGLLLNDKQQLTFNILDIWGRHVRTIRMEGQRGLNSFRIQGLGQLTGGTYLLRIKTNEYLIQQKLIKLP